MSSTRRAFSTHGITLLAALVAGLGYTVALPPYNAWPVAWCCFVPLMCRTRTLSARAALVAALVMGWSCAVATGWWAWAAPQVGLGASAIVSTVFFLGIFGPLIGLGMCLGTALAARGVRAGWPGGPVLAWPMAWLAGELLRSAGPLALPWCLLGVTQSSRPAAIQIVELGGTSLLSALIIVANACFAEGIVRRQWRYAVAGLFVPLFVNVYGALRLPAAGTPPPGSLTRVAVIQGNFPQRDRRRSAAHQGARAVHVLLSQRALAVDDLEVLVWPESSAGRRRTDHPRMADELLAALQRPAPFADAADSPRTDFTLIAACEAVHGLPSDPATPEYNAAFSIAPGAAPPLVYFKRRLVPFTEAVPFGLDRLDLLRSRGTFSASLRAGPDAPRLLAHGSTPVGALICFEFVFPDTLLSTVRAGAEWLAIMSNDAWYDFGDTALAQHHAQVALAAAATRRTIVRATNTGLTGGFDAWGRPLPFVKAEVLSTAAERAVRDGGDAASLIHAADFTAADPAAPHLPRGRAAWGSLAVASRTGRSLFVRAGNWPCWLGLLVCVLCEAASRRTPS